MSNTETNETTSPIDAVMEKWHQHMRGELPGGLGSLLHDDVVFWSPIVFTPQRGKDITMLYLGAAGNTLGGDSSAPDVAPSGASEPSGDATTGAGDERHGGFRYVREVLSGHDAVLEFETAIDGKYVNGIDMIRCDDDGMIVDIKVMVRPLQAINTVHAAMKAMLEKMSSSVDRPPEPSANRSANWTIEAVSPHISDVRGLVQTHLAFSRSTTDLCRTFALDTEQLDGDNVTLYAVREGTVLLAIGALNDLGRSHVEIKSMHTAEPARGRGVGGVLLDHLIAVAIERGCDRISLETGTGDAFGPARALYASRGFAPCAPFADYPDHPDSVCMTRRATEQPSRDGE